MGLSMSRSLQLLRTVVDTLMGGRGLDRTEVYS